MSPDGQFFWDGRQWVPTVTSDGRWRWNGATWESMAPLDPNNPAGLAQMLPAQAEETYAQAGALLAARRGEWAAEPALQGVLTQADQLAGAVQNDNAQLLAMNQQNVFNKVLAGSERKRLETDLQQATSALRAVIIQIGRSAHATTFPDADVLLNAARATEQQSLSIGKAMAAQKQAEADYQALVAAAQQQLQQAEGARASAVATALAAVHGAQATYDQAGAVARGHLGEARMPGSGEGIGSFAGALLYGNHIQTADGRGLTAGSEVYAGTAAELWKEHRKPAGEAMALGSAGAAAFHEAQTQGSDATFLLIVAPGLRSIVAVPSGQEEAAAQFAEQAGTAATAGEAGQAERTKAITAAQAELDRVTAERAALEAAEAEQKRVEADPELLKSVETAQAALASTQGDTAEVETSRARLAALITVATTPPAPLQIAQA